ncbi:MAG: heliCase, c-terminal:dead/deah box helicase, n-terminal [Gemmatimonadetes bacterium]|nr:heliCase, c-terminal:dead/deah box helicase, n-terminal [Gemmatimonadota bacterium]
MSERDDRLLRLIDALELSTDGPAAALLRRVFWRAASSSPAALAETTAAYERLLLHAKDATRAGRAVTRSDIRRFAGADEAQLVLWEMVAHPGKCVLSVADLPGLADIRREATIACRHDDARAAALRALLSDDVPSLVFTTRRATVRYLRDRLSHMRPAWCSGAPAGIGPLRAPRGTVLDWFRSDAPVSPLAPRHLITTDVAAEGLDLSRLRRVVHYDLPWTPARIEQREGRSRRGARAHLSTSQVIPLSSALEQRLQLGAILNRKRALPARVGVGGGEESVWHWREALARDLGMGQSITGVAVVAGPGPGLLAGIEIVELAGDGAAGAVVGRSLLWSGAGANWSNEAEAVPMLRWAALQEDAAQCVTRAERRAAVGRLAAAVRDLLRQHEAAAWWRRGDASARTLLQRLYAMVRPASRARDRDTLTLVERAIRFAGGGHTAGERILIQHLAAMDDAALVRRLPHLPAPASGSGLLGARLSGLIVIRDGDLPFPGRRDTFGAHDTL